MKFKILFILLSLAFLSSVFIFANELPTNIKELEKQAKNDPALMVQLGDMYAQGNGVVKDEKKALDCYNKAAKKTAEGLYKSGYAYFYGIGTKRNIKKGWKLLNEAAAHNDKDACKEVADLLFIDNEYIIKNRDTALKYYEKAAINGNVESQLKLGYFYLYGELFDQDDNKAFHYFEMAAKLNNPVGQYEIANLYYDGVGVNENLKEAVKYYSLSADQGYAPALTSLGNLYLNGDGVNKNDETAVQYFRLASSQNYAPAFLSLGNRYYNGEGVTKDFSEAANYYKKAINIGMQENETTIKKIGDEYFIYGESLLDSIRYIRDNRFVHWLYEGASAEYRKKEDERIKVFDSLIKEIEGRTYFAEALNNLGELYRDGEGVKEDHEEAVRLIKHAADMGYAQAQYNYGKTSDSSYPYDSNSRHYMSAAASQGHAGANYELGIYHWNRDNAKPYDFSTYGSEYFKKAAEQGHAWANLYLGRCYYYGKGVAQNYEEAVKYFKFASDKGIGNAKEMLGTCYYYGMGVPEDEPMAAKYFKEGYDITGPHADLPQNCTFVFVDDEVAVYNVAKKDMMIHLSDKIKYFEEEEEFMVFCDGEISYYNPVGKELKYKPRFIVEDYYWNYGVNFSIEYDHPDKTEYIVEVPVFYANGAPYLYGGAQCLFAVEHYYPNYLSGYFNYSGGTFVSKGVYKKNTKLVLKVNIVDEDDEKVPFTNNNRPLEIYF